MRQVELRSVAGLVLALGISCSAFGGVNVLTYHNDNGRTGQNLQEKLLSLTTVNSNLFGKLFAYEVDGYVYAQPLYVSGLNIPGKGTRNVVFVATEHNSVYAFDADSNADPAGGLIWQVNLGPSAPTPSDQLPFHAIMPEVGITGTPVIDPGSKTLFVDAFTQEGTEFFHRVHALNLVDGSEQIFSPVTVTASVPGTGVGSSNGIVAFNPRQQLQRSALTLAGGNLYVAFAGFTDTPDTDPYHGWLIGFRAAGLKPLDNYVFNTTPNGTVQQFGQIAGRGAIWMAGDGPAVDAKNNLYFATGDGNFNAFSDSGGSEYGDSVVKLSTGGKLSVADYFTPFDQEYYQINDLDVGSGGVMLIPDQPGTLKHLMIAGGKPAHAYLINRDQMTTDDNHYDPTGTEDKIVQKMPLNGGSFGTPAYYNGTIYFGANKDVLRGYVLSDATLTADLPNLIGPRKYAFPGTTPSVSANHNNDGIVWTVQNANPAVLSAYNADDLRKEIYNSTQAGGRDQLPNGVKFVVPTIANGKVYVGAQYALTVFGLFTNDSPSGVGFVPGTYLGLFSQSSGVDLSSAGAVSMTVSKGGSFSGKLQTGTDRSSFHGNFQGLDSSVSISQPHGGTLTLDLEIDTNSDPSRIVGTVSDGNWSSDLVANRAMGKDRSQHFPLAGRYTMILPGESGDPQLPQGDGFGAVLVSPTGRASFKGALADGTKVVQAVSLSADGQWPFYATSKGGEQLLGWLTLDGSGDLGGTLNWIKPSSPGAKFYPDGFNFNVAATGSPYQPPPVNFSAGVVTLSGGNLSSDISSDVTVNGTQANGNGAERVTLKFVPSTGLFKGSAANPAGGKAIGFSGAILQNQNSGSGFFLGTDQSGRVSFGPP